MAEIIPVITPKSRVKNRHKPVGEIRPDRRPHHRPEKSVGIKTFWLPLEKRRLSVFGHVLAAVKHPFIAIKIEILPANTHHYAYEN